MGFRPRKPSRSFIQRDIQVLARTFTPEPVQIRRVSSQTWVLGQMRPVETIVFSGEALFVPAGADVQRFGLGQVESHRPLLLVPGRWDIRQGDFVTYLGSKLQVADNPDLWAGSFQVVRLQQYAQ